MKKFKAGDSVVVIKELVPRVAEYTYKLGYVFTIAEHKEGDESNWIYEEGDKEWYTEKDCLRLSTKLEKILK